MGIGKEMGLLYFLELDNISTKRDNLSRAFSSLKKSNLSFLWHQRLGHVPFKRLRQFPSIKNEITNSGSISECLICLLDKQTRSPFDLINSQSLKVFSLLHMICGDHTVIRHMITIDFFLP